MEYKPQPHRLSPAIPPRLILHGGAGNITPSNLPPPLYKQYRDAMLPILADTHAFLMQGHDAIDTVTFAVERLENCALFNSGKGAVFTRDGTNELEASLMVSRGKKKRGVGVMGLAHVKNPIKLAREMLLRGEKDLEGGNGEHRGPMSSPVPHFQSKSDEGGGGGEGDDEDEAKSKAQPPSGGAQGHSQLFGPGAEKLAQQWGLEVVSPSYFFTQTRWDEHVRGLEREQSSTGLASWDAHEYVPQGTCGAVALDADGVLAVATSTGGMTNKLAGRIGDTPTLGGGFWAEEWELEEEEGGSSVSPPPLSPFSFSLSPATGPVVVLSESLKGLMADCLPSLGTYAPRAPSGRRTARATALSGTGNGDSFLRLSAGRTASAIARYRPASLAQGVKEMAGPGGELQKSAGDRWRRTGEGEAGMIGIELVVLREADGMVLDVGSEVVEEWNCGGMFRAVVDEGGRGVFRVWRDGEQGLEGYVGEGRGEDLRAWRSEKRSQVLTDIRK